MPRRCFELGLEMLARLHHRNPDIEIILFGSGRIDSGCVPFGHANLGLLPSVEDLAALYRNADLGIVFSTTNPSLVPYEMMACGLAVCDLDLEAAVTNYGSEENVFLLNLDPEAMADQLLNILFDEGERQRRAEWLCLRGALPRRRGLRPAHRGVDCASHRGRQGGAGQAFRQRRPHGLRSGCQGCLRLAGQRRTRRTKG